MTLPAPLETIYEKYSATLYGIALKIAGTQNEAEEIVIATFEKIFHQSTIQNQYPSTAIGLIKILIQTSHEQFGDGEQKNTCHINPFNKMPMLDRLLFDEISLEDLCNENNISRMQLAKTIRAEVKWLQYLQQKNKVEVYNP